MSKLFLMLCLAGALVLLTSCGTAEEEKTSEIPDTESCKTDRTEAESSPADDSYSADTVETVPDWDPIHGDSFGNSDIINPIEGFESYFAFMANGVINDGNSFDRPTTAIQSKVKAVLPGHTSIKLALSMSYFHTATHAANAEFIEFTVLADPNETYYTTLVTVSFNKQELLTLKDEIAAAQAAGENPVTIFESAPETTVYSMTKVTDTILKQCLIAINDYDEEKSLLPGKTDLSCITCNKEFAPDEIMRAAANIKLTEEPAKIMKLTGKTDESELCSCRDSEKEIPCP